MVPGAPARLKTGGTATSTDSSNGIARELADVPLAVFGMGPRTDTEDAWHRSYAQFHRALRKHRWAVQAVATVGQESRSR